MVNVGGISYKIEGDNSSFRSDVSESKNIAIKAASAIGQAFVTAMAAAGAAIAAAVTAGVKINASQEQAMAKVQTVMDTTAVSADDLKEGLLALSNETGLAFEELADSAYNAISATGDTAGALDLVSAASKLAIAGFTSQESSLSALTTAINAYGYATEDAQSISDSFIATQNLGVLTVDQLAGSMGKAISTASAYGVNLGNLESAYVSLTKSGISVEESTTYLSSLLNELGDSGSAVGKILQDKTGKSLGKLMEDGYTLADVMGILNDSVDGDAEALMNLWGSAEAGKAANAIVSQGLEEFNSNLETITNSAGTTQSAFETMQDTLSAQFEILKTSAENALGGMMSSLADVAKNEVIPGLIDDLDELQAAFDEGGFAGAAGAMGDIVAGWLVELSDAIPDIMDAAGEMVGALVEGITENADVIAEGAVSIIESLFDAFLELTPMLLELGVELLVALVQGISENAGSLVDGAYTIITTLMDSITAALPELIPAAVSIILELVNALVDPANLTMLIQSAIQLILALAMGLIQAIPQLIMAIPDIITSLVQAIIDNVPVILQAGIQLTIALAKGLLAAIASLVAAGRRLCDNIAQIIVDQVSKWIETGKKWVNGIKDGISNTWHTITDWIKNGILKLINVFTDMKSKIMDTGKNIVNGIWDGITGAWSNLVSNVKEKVSGLVSTIKKALKISSPSKVMKEIFVNFVAGGDVGFDEKFPSFEKKVTREYTGLFSGIKAESAVTPAAAIAGSGGNVLQLTVPLEVDGREFARATAEYTGQQLSYLQ